MWRHIRLFIPPPPVSCPDPLPASFVKQKAMTKYSKARIDVAINFTLAKGELESLKEEQKAILTVASGVFISLLTRYGKTYSFVLLPLIYDYLHVRPSLLPYVSPLIVLLIG